MVGAMIQAARSLAFNVAFYATMVVLLVVMIPTLLMPRGAVIAMARLWGFVSLWLLRVICGVRVEFRGLANLPRGACLVASKHQSTWETFALLTIVDDFCFILKRELLFVPLFGWLAMKGEMIAVDRSRGGGTLARMAAAAADRLARGRRIFIFPEGTRRPVGAPPRYKWGVAHLYAAATVPCVPVALNSGLFWPRRRFLRRPGTIVVEILEPIAPGLAPAEFKALLEARIETATDRLVAEAIACNPDLASALTSRPEPEAA